MPPRNARASGSASGRLAAFRVGPGRRVGASGRTHLHGCGKGRVCHLEEMNAPEHFDKAGSVEGPFLDGEVELLDPMLVRVSFPHSPKMPLTIDQGKGWIGAVHRCRSDAD